MKSIFSSFAIALVASSFNVTADNYHVGEISNTEILTSFDKFKKHENDVTYSQTQIDKLKQFKQDVEIKVYFGQWCHDSQREVPRLIKLFDQLDQDNFKVWYYGVDLKKSDPLGLAKADNLRRTPTIIVYQDGKELGRILEVPRVDWASDIAALLSL